MPVQPILLETGEEWALFADLARYPWVLPTASYATQEALIAQLAAKVIEPAERKAQELTKKMPPKASPPGA